MESLFVIAVLVFIVWAIIKVTKTGNKKTYIDEKYTMISSSEKKKFFKQKAENKKEPEESVVLSAQAVRDTDVAKQLHSIKILLGAILGVLIVIGWKLFGFL